METEQKNIENKFLTFAEHLLTKDIILKFLKSSEKKLNLLETV